VFGAILWIFCGATFVGIATQSGRVHTFGARNRTGVRTVGGIVETEHSRDELPSEDLQTGDPATRRLRDGAWLLTSRTITIADRICPQICACLVFENVVHHQAGFKPPYDIGILTHRRGAFYPDLVEGGRRD